MIESLRIERLAVVESLELELGPGLNVLTGETGAGKSIVLGAFGLLAGGRASSDAVRSGCDEAVVEALFRTDALPDLERELAERGFSVEDHAVPVRRSISESGRSRARLAGQLVPASLLAEMFGERIEISSQHGSQALLRGAEQSLLVDTAGGLLEQRAAVAEAHAALRELDLAIAALQGAADERARRLDFLAFQRDEIDAAQIQPGEISAAAEEHARLAHADRLREEGGSVAALLTGDPTRPEGTGAADQVGAAVRQLEGLVALDPSLAERVERLRSLDLELRDLALEMERYVDGLESDPARLARVEERLAQLDRLRRKYGSTVEEIQAHRDRVAGELEAIGGADERLEGMVRERQERAAALARAAGCLSEGRRLAARCLGQEVETRLADLMLPGARLEVSLVSLPAPEGLPCGPTGAEAVQLRFSANPGEPPRPLQRVVSGGELSRLFLAVKGALRGARRGMVLVFDEVDAGIGGRAAERVARSLADLAVHHQVLCITHLPQIAAFAEVHFRVHKASQDGRTHSGVRRLTGDARVEEIARMAGGESVGPATLRHARELLRARESA